MVGTQRHHRRWQRFPYILLAAILALLVACGSDNPAGNFGDPVAGQRVYDRSGTLSAAELRDLEDRAAAVTRAGAPAVVYLRAHDADEDETQEDARDLMAAWSVESAPSARDGVVIFLNLDPDDTRHGQVALFAGERHYQDGNLPERELARIFEDEMRPLLAGEQLAAGIGAGLDALARSLAFGPPPPPVPSAFQRAAGQVAGLPLNALAILATLGATFLAARSWRGRTTPASPGAATLTRPGDLAPPLAGALVARRINAPQLAEATLLDLARRGALVVEPADHRSARVRPLDSSILATNHEQQLWSALAASTDADGTVSSNALGKLRSNLGNFQSALQSELVARGWYDPAAGARRRPAYIAGSAALVASALAIIITIVGQQFWGFLATGLFLVSGIALLSVGYSLPETTAQGERAAAPWHAYRAGLEQAARDPNHSLDLDAILPDATALGLIGKFDKRLKEASNAGYAPAWFVRTGTADANVAFYPIWIAFHSTTSSTGSSGGSTAATGGGGAGGSF
jgi:uncharacterized membrane protein YgcG